MAAVVATQLCAPVAARFVGIVNSQLPLFIFCLQVLNDPDITNFEKDCVRQTVLENIDRVVRTDPRRAAKLVMVTLCASISDVVGRISNSADGLSDGGSELFEFLTRVFEYLNMSSAVIDGGSEHSVSTFTFLPFNEAITSSVVIVSILER